jgi:aerobic carbon-monoxide dehydrogenase small subunit
MTEINLTVNGRAVRASVDPRLHLADFLREHLRLTGTHLGCEHGVCGACTIEIDGAPARSCIALAVACDGGNLRTIEGFEDDPLMTELREAFSADHALQCGFCTPGMLISARDIVRRLPAADEKRIRLELAGNLCRCTGYQGIVNAITRVLANKGAWPTASARASAVARISEFVPFAPSGAAAAVSSKPAPVEKPAAAGVTPASGWTDIEESFLIHRPPEEVWQALDDIALVATCLPGAELTERDGDSVKGRMRVKLGPIIASFAGAATVDRDERQLVAVVRGAGSDGGTGSRTRGEVEYRLVAAPGSATGVKVTIRYSLQGALAQFSRSNVARDFAARLVAQFATNLNARLDPDRSEPPPVAGAPVKLDLGAQIWAWIKGKLRAFIGREGRRK